MTPSRSRMAEGIDWTLECLACGSTSTAEGLPTVCSCGQPWLVRYPNRRPGIMQRAEVRRRHGMWRFREFLPLRPFEDPVSLGEGDTPLIRLRRTATRLGVPHLWLKDEGINPTGSFKARGLSAAITRATAAGQRRFTLPTAGNAGVAASAYAARAGAEVKVFAPDSTPRTILSPIEAFGGELVLLRGHIGDCGKASRAWAAESGAFDLSTLREPYRIEGKKTLGLELALQLAWKMPDVILYPTGGGTGLIGMWKAFLELKEHGWVEGDLPRFYSVQSTGCAPIVRAFEAGAEHAEVWNDPWTVASGLRVPGPLGDRLMLRALRETNGGAVAVEDAALTEAADTVSREEGVDVSPEGGAALAALEWLVGRGQVDRGETIVVFNTGAGWLYRQPGDLRAER